jgi:DNA invertase Pin-like site-specific DNA recombinase
MISVMSAFSELGRGMIVQRVVAGAKKAQAAGKLAAGPVASSGATKPPGYAKMARAGPLSAASY